MRNVGLLKNPVKIVSRRCVRREPRAYDGFDRRQAPGRHFFNDPNAPTFYCYLELKMKMIPTILLTMLLTGCAGAPDPQWANAPTGAQRVYWACENLRCSDPTIARQAISGLFGVGGLEAYTLLHLKWIAEPNPEIRKYILEGFSKIGDHRHIADPDFPQEWVKAAKRFSSPEKEIRLRELKEHFPEETKRMSR